MAKKKPAPAAPLAPRVLVRLELDPETRRDLAAVAGVANVSMALFARRAVEDAVRAAKKNLEKSFRNP